MNGADPYLPDHGDPSYAVEHYDLDLTYAVASNRLSGTAVLTATAAETLTDFRVDLAGLRVGKLTLDGRPVAGFQHSGNRIRVRPRAPIPAGTTFELRVGYAGNPRPLRARHHGTAGWEELTDGVIVASQPHGAPTWFPCNDRPSDKAAYRIALAAPTGYRVVANGTLTETQRRASTTQWVYEQTQPMAPYLATVQIGDYVWVEQSAGPVPVRAAVPHRLLGDFERGFGRQVEMLEAFTRMFGPYPFDSYSVVITDEDLEIPLESQSLSTFGANFCTDDWAATRLVAHELSHQWFGNSLTCASWRDIWLHEGFACYAEWLWSEESGFRSADEQAEQHWRRLSRLDEDLLLGDPGPELMFDDRVYKRGALTLHAVRRTVGDSAFFGLLRDWASERRYGTVTTDEFTDFASGHTGVELGPLLRDWVWKLPLPRL